MSGTLSPTGILKRNTTLINTHNQTSSELLGKSIIQRKSYYDRANRESIFSTLGDEESVIMIAPWKQKLQDNIHC